MWIRIRTPKSDPEAPEYGSNNDPDPDPQHCPEPRAMDPHLFSLLDPDPGGLICQLKTEKCKEIANNCNLIKFFKSKFAKAPLFLTFEQSFMFFTTKENYS